MGWSSSGYNDGGSGSGGGTVDPSVLQPYVNQCIAAKNAALTYKNDAQSAATTAQTASTSAQTAATSIIDNCTFTEENPIPQAWDNIPAGFIPKNKTSKDVLLQQLYPYLNPAFTAAAISTWSPTREVGNPVLPNGNLTFTVSNSNNLLANSVRLYTHNNALVKDNISTSPVALTVGTWSESTPKTTNWVLKGTNTNNIEFTRNISMSWMHAIYYGALLTDSPTEAQLKSLTKLLKTSFTGDYVIDNGGYKYLMYPTSFGIAFGFKDKDTGFGISMSSPQTLSITNDFGVTVSYYIYRTVNESAASLTMAVT